MKYSTHRFRLTRDVPSFHIFLYVTVPNSQCQICPIFSEFLREISKAYYNHDKSRYQKKLYFLEVEYSQATHHLVASLQIQHAPAFVLFKAGVRAPVMLEDPLSKNIAQFLSEETGIKVTIDPSRIDINQFAGQQMDGMSENREAGANRNFFTILFGLFILSLSLALIYSFMTFWWTWKKFFAVISVISYIMCIGGTIYCVLNDGSFWYSRGGVVKVF